MSDSPHPRPIRSFVLRTGRITPAQARALAEAGTRFCVPYRSEAFDWSTTFGREAPRVLEIGFGMGETTARIAADNPGTDYLAVEVHTPGVGALLRRMEELGVGNIRIVQHDAVEVLRDMLGPDSLDGVHVFFPDPWPKKRHHKRRLLQPEFVHQIALRLKPDGYLHVATDWEDYARSVLETLLAEPLLTNTASGFAERPVSRPLTKFEARGQRLGHGVFDLVFRRREAPR